jgi:hypothetical protein
MKISKKTYMIGGSVLLILLFTGFGLVAALEPWGGFHPRRGFHHGFDHKDIAEFLLWRMDKKMKALNLSEEQQEKYNQIRSNIEKQLTEGMDDRKMMMDTFQREMSRENPDVRLLAGMVKTKIDEVSGMMNENLDLVVGFYESLNEAQKNEVLNAIRERMEAHHSWTP